MNIQITVSQSHVKEFITLFEVGAKRKPTEEEVIGFFQETMNSRMDIERDMICSKFYNSSQWDYNAMCDLFYNPE